MDYTIIWALLAALVGLIGGYLGFQVLNQKQDKNSQNEAARTGSNPRREA